MARYNEVSLSRKKELEEPDEVTENLRKIFAFILKYRVRIGMGVSLFFLLIIGVVTAQYFSHLSENKASSLLDKGIAKYNAMQNEKKPAEICDLIESDFKIIITQYPRTVAGKFAVLQLANIYYSADKYNDAIAFYEKAIESFEGSVLFENLIQMGLGLCHEAKGDHKKAIVYFEKVISDPDSLMLNQALFNAGRIYEKMGEKGKRADVYKKIVSDFNNSLYSDIAKEYISG
jgi:tetratricopeptide (TPR) repeat protein